MPMFRLMLSVIRRKRSPAPQQQPDAQGMIEVEDSTAFMIDYFNKISGQTP